MGMELELPIVIVDDQGNNVTHKIAIIEWLPYFKVEGDASWAAGAISHPKANALPTNIEIVTEAFDEHLPLAEGKLADQILKIHEFVEAVQALTAKQTRSTTVGALIKSLEGAKLGAQVPATAANWLVGVPTTGRAFDPPAANVHFTVGIRYQSIVEAASWIHQHSFEGSLSPATHVMAKDAVVGLVDSLDESFMHLTPSEQQAVFGFCYLVFSNAQAVAIHDVGKKELAKNYAPMLSRTSFTSVLASLPPKSKTFVKTFGKAMANVLEKSLLDSAGAKEYLQDSFAGQAKAQTNYFHGMRMLGTEPVGPENSRDQGVPVELRDLGKRQFRKGKEWVRLAYKVLAASQQWHGTTDVSKKYVESLPAPASKVSAPAMPPASGVAAPKPLVLSPVVVPPKPSVQPPVSAAVKVPASGVGGAKPPAIVSPGAKIVPSPKVSPSVPSSASPRQQPPVPAKQPAPGRAEPKPVVVSPPVSVSSRQPVSVPAKQSAPSLAAPKPLVSSPVVPPPQKVSSSAPPVAVKPAPQILVSAMGPGFIPPSVHQIAAIKGGLKPPNTGQ
jgi:hypothetical protein